MRYYSDELDNVIDVSWKDDRGKKQSNDENNNEVDDNYLIKTIVKVSAPENLEEWLLLNSFSADVPSGLLLTADRRACKHLFTITLYFTTNNIVVQGPATSQWLQYEYQRLNAATNLIATEIAVDICMESVLAQVCHQHPGPHHDVAGAATAVQQDLTAESSDGTCDPPVLFDASLSQSRDFDDSMQCNSVAQTDFSANQLSVSTLLLGSVQCNPEGKSGKKSAAKGKAQLSKKVHQPNKVCTEAVEEGSVCEGSMPDGKDDNKVPAVESNGSAERKQKKMQERKQSELDAWKRNIEQTINKLDVGLVEAREVTGQLALDNLNLKSDLTEIKSLLINLQPPPSTPAMTRDEMRETIRGEIQFMQEENSDLRSEMEELKHCILDTQRQTVNKLRVLEELMGQTEDNIVKAVQKAIIKETKSSCDRVRSSVEKLACEVAQIASKVDNIVGGALCNPASVERTPEPTPPLINLHDVTVEEWIEDTGHVYIGRASPSKGIEVGSKWQNPFHLQDYNNDRKVVVHKFRRHLLADEELMADILELDGKQLGCFCVPNECHGQVLLEVVAERKRLLQHGTLQPDAGIEQQHQRDTVHTATGTERQHQHAAVPAAGFHQQAPLHTATGTERQQHDTVPAAGFQHALLHTTTGTERLQRDAVPAAPSRQTLLNRSRFQGELAQQVRSTQQSSGAPGVAVRASAGGHQQGHQDARVQSQLQRRDTGEQEVGKEVVILMDSNRKHIDFHKMFGRVRIIPCSTVEHVENNINNLGNPAVVIIHVGVNDISNRKDPKVLAARLMDIASWLTGKYRCRVVVSEVTPLKGAMENINVVNSELRATVKDAQVRVVAHRSLTTNHLGDDRHLISDGSASVATAVEILVADLFSAVTGQKLSLQEQKNTYRRGHRSGTQRHY